MTTEEIAMLQLIVDDLTERNWFQAADILARAIDELEENRKEAAV